MEKDLHHSTCFYISVSAFISILAYLSVYVSTFMSISCCLSQSMSVSILASPYNLYSYTSNFTGCISAYHQMYRYVYIRICIHMPIGISLKLL